MAFQFSNYIILYVLFLLLFSSNTFLQGKNVFSEGGPVVERPCLGGEGGNSHLFFVAEHLHKEVAVLAAEENHLEVGGHADALVASPAFLGRCDWHGLVITLYAKESQQRNDTGIVAEAQICAQVAVGCQCFIGLGDEIPGKAAGGAAALKANLFAGAVSSKEAVVKGDALAGELVDVKITEDIHVQEVKAGGYASGHINGADKTLRVCNKFAGLGLVRENGSK